MDVFRVKVNRRGDWLLARLATSAGLTGIGDASQSGRDEETTRLLDQFFNLLKGRSVFEIEWLRRAANPQNRPAATALSALEQCLFDLQGQLLGVPCYNLFGGLLQTRIRNYANINRSTDDRSPAGFARMAERAVQAGFDAVKLAPFDGMPRDRAKAEEFTRLGIECARAVRHLIGPKRDLLIDAHSNFDLERGLELARRFEPLNLFWLEEVTPARPVESLAAINRAARMPTAGGESLYGVKAFYPYLAAQAVDILMPDVKYCGGMLELKKIAALAEAVATPVSPHGPASPVGNFAAAHVSATLPNFLILEFSYGEVPWRAELIDPPEQLMNGCLALSQRAGLGVTLNQNTLRRFRY
jgi:galactonate dehydratase